MYSILLFWNYTVIMRILNQMKLKIKSKLSTSFNIFNEYFLLSKINRKFKSTEVYYMQSTVLRASYTHEFLLTDKIYQKSFVNLNRFCKQSHPLLMQVVYTKKLYHTMILANASWMLM
jgi:hypothetical protein